MTARVRAPLVGRTRELALLEDRVAALTTGAGSFVLVAGEPGIGKTRLALELVAQARRRGCRVLVGRAYESDGTPPYLPFVEALREYARTCPLDELRAQLGEGAVEVALILRDVRARLPDLATRSAAGPEPARYRLFESIADFLANVARAAPGGLLLVLDDLHWADTPSFLLLQHLARGLASVPLLLVGTYRTVDLDRTHPLSDLLAELHRERLAERIPLPAFSASESASLIEELNGRPAAPELAETLHHETAGNPFFLEEVVRHLLAEGRDLTDPSASAGWVVPEGVRQVIGKRLARLGAEANRLLQVGAVLDDGFVFEVLAAASGLPLDSLMDALDETIAAGVLREEAGRYAFAHPLIRQTLYAELSAPRRARLHLQAGEALQHVYAANSDPHLAGLAHHFFRAAPLVDASTTVDYARRAAARALAVLAYEEAARLFALAVEALDLDDSPDDATRCELLLALGDARRRAGEPHAAMETFRQAAETGRRLVRPGEPARADGDATLLARAASGFEDALLATGLPRQGLGDPSIRLQQEALNLLAPSDSAPRARLLAGLARTLRFAGETERSALLAEDALAMARRLGDPATLVYALNAWRIAAWSVDDLAARLATAIELRRLAEAAGDHELALEGRLWEFRALLEMGEVAAAQDELRAYGDLAEALGQPHYRSLHATWTAVIAILEGRFADAERWSEQALASGHRGLSRDAAMFFQVLQLTLHREQGRERELDEMVRVTRELIDQGQNAPILRANLALLYCDLDRPAEARQELERLAAHDFADLPRDWIWLPTLITLAVVCATLGDRRRAARLHELLRPYAERSISGASCPGTVAYHLGLLAATVGRLDEAEAHYQLAVRHNAQHGARPALARTQQAYGALLLARRRRGDLARAHELLAAALARFEELGMPRDAAAARALLADPRLAAAQDRPPAYPDGLTEREVEVLRCIAAGMSNREIADELVLSIRTVERHITNLYRKIDARGKADATAYALRRGLVGG